MMSVPGIKTRTPPGPTEVRCRCGAVLLSLPAGQRLSPGGADRFIPTTCKACGASARLPVSEDRA